MACATNGNQDTWGQKNAKTSNQMEWNEYY